MPGVDHSFAHAIERIEGEAWRQHQLASPPGVQEQYAITVRELAGATLLLASRGDLLGMNRVFALGFSSPADAELLDRLVEIYGRARVPRFLLHWSPLAGGSAPGSFGALGFKPVSRMAKLYRRTDATVIAPTDLDIRRIGIESAVLYGEVVATGHGDPPELAAAHAATVGGPQWRHYLAFSGNRAVAGAALFWSGKFAWCGFSSTLPSHRSLGAHSGLLARRIRDAAEVGCSWIVCETAEETAARPNPAYRNMRRTGFDIAYFRENLLHNVVSR